MVGHVRGARTASRLALDHHDSVASVALMDIVLAQPAPFPERLIAGDPGFFFKNCLFARGAAGVKDFDARQLPAYRASWPDEAKIAGYCNDYRTALAVGLVKDRADGDGELLPPTLVLFGASGSMARLYYIPATGSIVVRH